ncbi:MAG: outer membrane protein assembly factor BamD [Kiritimatiellae bacterium]|nr:outer membrane protein assembly factor BamD [Kiritimatiellia bacterium]
MKSRQFANSKNMKNNFFYSKPILLLTITCLSTILLGNMPNKTGNIAGEDFTGTPTETSIVSAPEFKQKGLFFGGPTRKTPAEQLRYAEVLEKNKKYKAATKEYNALVIEWPTAQEAPTAQLGVARTLELREEYLKAFKEYQYLIDNYEVRHLPEGISFIDILNSQFRIANYYLTKLDNSFLGIGSIGVKGVTDAFAQIARNAPEWERASECLLRRGVAYETVGKNIEAIMEYEDLVGRYAGTPVANEALFRAAIARYNLALKAPRDEKTLRNAIVAMGLAISADPYHQYVETTIAHKKELEEMLTALLFEKARFYDKIKPNVKAALISYRSFVKEFPVAKETEKAKQRISELEEILKKEEAEKESTKQ